MSLDAHVVQLRRKHESLDRMIEEEQRRPGTDDLALTRLKREKLQLKDEIAKLVRH
ncbi:MAG: DUF465 domain-containing protein [Pseudomonadota bacterium]